MSCPVCSEVLAGEVVTAGGARYHAKCFVCTDCGSELESFFQKDGKFLCTPCYNTTYGRICAGCVNLIEGGVGYVTALGKPWHADCFVCTTCRKALPDNFSVLGGHPFCSSDCINARPNQEAKGVCAKCNEEVYGEAVRALDALWHPNCLVCKHCSKPIGERIVRRSGDIFCSSDCSLEAMAAEEEAAQAEGGSGGATSEAASVVCDQCGEAITGNATRALGKTFHPDCLKCTGCSTVLTGTFLSFDGAPFCGDDCFNAAHPAVEETPAVNTEENVMCLGCQRVIDDLQNACKALDSFYHLDCFLCETCGTAMGTDFMVYQSKPYCSRECISSDPNTEVALMDEDGAFKDSPCAKCGETIGDATSYDILGGVWHKSCFNCEQCSAAFTGGTFLQHKERPFCTQACVDTFKAAAPAATTTA